MRLQSLAIGRKRNDLFLVYKVLFGKTYVIANYLFRLVPSYTKGNRLKLSFARPRTTLKRQFFMSGCIGVGAKVIKKQQLKTILTSPKQLFIGTCKLNMNLSGFSFFMLP